MSHNYSSKFKNIVYNSVGGGVVGKNAKHWEKQGVVVQSRWSSTYTKMAVTVQWKVGVWVGMWKRCCSSAMLHSIDWLLFRTTSLHCVTSQKSKNLFHTMAEAWNCASYVEHNNVDQGCKNLAARLPWRLNFIWWHPIFVDSRYGPWCHPSAA